MGTGGLRLWRTMGVVHDFVFASEDSERRSWPESERDGFSPLWPSTTNLVPFILLADLAVNILYLENHAVFAEQVTREFLREHRVTIVPSLAAARTALVMGDFDLVLSDYDLDDGKGEEFVRECRAARLRLPIIAVSSHEAGNAALVAAGASAVCSKMQFDRIRQVIAGLKHESGAG